MSFSFWGQAGCAKKNQARKNREGQEFTRAAKRLKMRLRFSA